MPPGPFFHHSGLACSWVPLSGEGGLLSAPSCQPLESETGPESVVGNAFSDAVISSLRLSGSPRGSLRSRFSELQTHGWREGGSDPGGSGCRAGPTAGGGGLGVGWAGTPTAGPAPQAGAGPRGMRRWAHQTSGLREPLPGARRPLPAPLGQRLSPPGWDGRQRDTPTAVLPMSTPGLGRCFQSPASCTCRSEFMTLFNLAFNSIQVQMTSN